MSLPIVGIMPTHKVHVFKQTWFNHLNFINLAMTVEMLHISIVISQLPYFLVSRNSSTCQKSLLAVTSAIQFGFCSVYKVGYLI